MSIDSSVTVPLWVRVRQTFTAPSRLASSIRGRAPWLDALLITTLIAILSVAAMPDEVFTEPMRDAVSRRGEPVEITSDPAVVAAWGRGMGMLATLATQPILVISMAGLLSLIFSLLGQGRTGFQEYLSLASHALLIPALGSLIALLVRLGDALAGGSITLGAFYSPAEAPNLFIATLVSIDPFIIWMLIAVAVAVHALEPKHGKGRAATILIGGYLLFVLASTAMLHPELRGASKTPPETFSAIPA